MSSSTWLPVSSGGAPMSLHRGEVIVEQCGVARGSGQLARQCARAERGSRMPFGPSMSTGVRERDSGSVRANLHFGKDVAAGRARRRGSDAS